MPQFIDIDIRQGVNATRPALSLPVRLEACPDFKRYIGSLSIAGVFFHIEAVETIRLNGDLRAVDSELDSRVANYYAENDCDPQLVKINDRLYFVYVEPHAQ